MANRSHNDRHLQIALELCRSSGSTYAKRAATLLLNGTYKLPSLCPDAYSDHIAFAKDYAVYAYLRKFNSSGKAKAQLETNAILSFKETECSISSFNRGFPLSAALTGDGHLLSVMRRKIGEVLGPFRANEWFDGCEWGPGATASLKGDDSTLDKKILEPKLSVSALALPFARAYLEADIHMFAARAGTLPEGPYSVLRSEFAVTDCSRLTTVDKSVSERRVIDIQPTMNLFLQKGLGIMIRRRLKRVGVDLDSQSRNQWLASVAGRLQLCTIDLAKASDTVSTSLVRDLLPTDWLHALHCTRTPFTRYGSEQLYLHKFSAMGNGYTFELESLIFWSLLKAVQECTGGEVEGDVFGVYGDDLICPRRLSKGVIRALTVCGFSVNSEKSFLRGPFYESCGNHYFNGREVTPPYQKEALTDFTACCLAHNRLWRWALRLGGGISLEVAALRPCRMALAYAREEWDQWMHRRIARNPKARPLDFPFVPWYAEVDSLGIISTKPFRRRGGFVTFPVVRRTPVRAPADHAALYSVSLRRKCVVETPFEGFVTLRGRLEKATWSVMKMTELVLRFPTWI